MPLAVLAQVKRETAGSHIWSFVFPSAFVRVHRGAVASTKADSWLNWTVSFDEESRARHIPAEGDRGCKALQQGCARLGARDRDADTTREHLLVRRVGARTRISDN